MTVEPLLARLRKRIPQHDDPQSCRLWMGALSLSGYRKVRYPALRHGHGTKIMWRVNRLVLILKTGLGDVPRNPGEVFEDWLLRANQHYLSLGLEAAHTCDTSLCVNELHLEWQDHAKNLAEAAVRKRARAV